jgi:hypothetical protein
MTGVKEIANPFVVIVIGFRLGKFVVVMGELEVDASRVKIH